MRIWQIRAVLPVIVFVVVISIGLCKYIPQLETGIFCSVPIIPGYICVRRVECNKPLVQASCTAAFVPNIPTVFGCCVSYNADR